MRTLFVLFLLCGLGGWVCGQNTYHQILELSTEGRWVRLVTPPELQIGQHILLYQAKGAQLVEGGESAGTVDQLRGAGQFGLLKITRVTGDTLFTNYPIPDGFDPVHTQAVVSASGDTVRTSGTVRARAFDGQLGGLVFLSADQRLIINDSLVATGSGFRGGRGQEVDSDCNRFTIAAGELYGEDDWRGSRRGEGVGKFGGRLTAGRAPAANGGGGGNDHNAGGGGGANTASGGLGGRNVVEGILNFACRGNFPGRGGRPLSTESNRLYLGGGGGAGHANNTSLSHGGNGGGLIVLWAPVVEFQDGALLLADGLPGASVDGDGAGGGGAGGSLMVIADSIFGTPLLSLRGGRGGDVTNMPDRCFGPGGGGGGGRLVFAVRSGGFQLNAEILLDRGGSGQRLGSEVCAPDSDPPGSGNNGSLQPIITPVPFPGFTLSADTLCSNDALTIINTSTGVNRVEWTLLEPDSTLFLQPLGPNLRVRFSPNTAGTFRVVQTLFVGNTQFPGDTAVFTVVPTISLAGTEIEVDDEYIQIDLQEAAGYTSIEYNFGDGTLMDTSTTTLAHTYTAGGNYRVTVTLFNERCGSIGAIDTTIFVPEFAMAITDIKESYGCTPYTLRVADLSFGSYGRRQWSFPGGTPDTSSQFSPTVIYADSGNYVITLRLLDAVGPDTLTTISVRVDPSPVADFSFTIDTATVSFANLSEGATDYLWNFGNRSLSQDENPTVSYDSIGTYTVSMSATYRGCTSRTERTVTISTLSDIGELSGAGISLFPNPTRDRLQVTGPALPIQVLDAGGRTLTVPINGREVDLSQLPEGIYLLRLQSGKRLYTARISVVR